ncbi:MAG: hypothetical protein IPG74_10130 [Flavobacteriales bacterium]|nr:hypothetical protein [Flavobacteriales bacterium]
MEKFSRLCATVVFVSAALFVNAQNIGINGTGAAPDATAILDLVSADKGLLVPRVLLTATNSALPVTAPATSLLVYNTATAGVAPNNVTPGYYYWNGAWIRLATGNSGWTLLGNAGTVAGTNFIGTTDANALVIKTGGSAAANERARVMPTGQVVVNNTAHFTGDVFSAYANNTTNGTTTSINNAAGTFALNGYASGNGTGVYGETNGGASTTGIAIWGDLYGANTTSFGSSIGVLGSNSTVPLGAAASTAIGVQGNATGTVTPANGFALGVLGTSTSTTGLGYGVYGGSFSNAAAGVFGINAHPALTSAGHGVQGQSTGATGAAGVRGVNVVPLIMAAGQAAYGVHGSTAAVAGPGIAVGVRGDAAGVNGWVFGLLGTSASPIGYGINGFNSSPTGTGLLVAGNNAAVSTFLANGSGAAFNGTGVGGFGIGKTAASGIGLVGVGNDLTGSVFTPASGAGVVGTGAQYGVMGFATTTVSTNGANNANTSGAAASSGGYFEVQAAGVAQTWAYVGVRDNGGVLRKIIGPGTVNTVVKDTQGGLVALSCPETPENLFQDNGSGRLVNGRAHVVLDPVLVRNIVVSEEHPLRVFVQLEGDCKGVYVTNKTQNGFDVLELDGGTSTVPFSWTITANRADEMNPDGTIARYSAERFPAAPGPQVKVPTATRELDSRVITQAPVTEAVAPLPKFDNRPAKPRH